MTAVPRDRPGFLEPGARARRGARWHRSRTIRANQFAADVYTVVCMEVFGRLMRSCWTVPCSRVASPVSDMFRVIATGNTGCNEIRRFQFLILLVRNENDFLRNFLRVGNIEF